MALDESGQLKLSEGVWRALFFADIFDIKGIFFLENCLEVF